jgi:hypothetical protein
MNCCWRNERNKSSVNLIKIEIAVTMNCKYTCKDFYVFVSREKVSSKQQSKTQSMFLNANNGPKLINWKSIFFIIPRMQQYISLLCVYQF